MRIELKVSTEEDGYGWYDFLLEGDVSELLQQFPDFPVDTSEWKQSDPEEPITFLAHTLSQQDTDLYPNFMPASTLTFIKENENPISGPFSKWWKERFLRLEIDDTTNFILQANDGKQYQVHKEVLLVRVPTFGQIFSGQGSSGNSGRFPDLAQGKYTFVDAGSPAVREFIRAIYCGEYMLRYEYNSAEVVQLLNLAEVYHLHDLKVGA